MIALPIISIVCCFAYVFYIVFKYGVPVSISETYYLLPNKWDILFAAWTVLTSVPFGIYWFQTAPDGLKWIPIVTMIALLMIGVADCYKSGPKKESYIFIDGEMKRFSGVASGYPGKFTVSLRKTKGQSLIDRIKDILKQFNPKEFFKYGIARFLHYTNSLLAITLATTYICITQGTPAIVSTALSYVVFIIVGSKVDGVYNPGYSLDYNNSAWIFFMECVCLINLFVFVL